MNGHPKRCGCEPCRQARYRYHKQWKYDRAHGRLRTIDATLVRRHIDSLVMQHAMTPRSIAAAAGVSASTVNQLYRGIATTIKRETAVKILAVTGPDDLSDTSKSFVSRVGAVRRIQAMLRMGWTHPQMRQLSGVKTAAILYQQGGWITRRNHLRIVAMYETHCMTFGGSTTTQARAQASGYPSPLAWDDDTIDDPNAAPNLDGSSPNLDWPEAAA